MRTTRTLFCTAAVALALSACGGTSSGAAATSTVAQSAPPASEPAADPIADCVDTALQAQSGVEVKNSSGLNVDSLVLGDGTTGLVFAPESGGNVCQWLSTAQLLTKIGYRTAVFNYSGAPGDQDVLALADELRRRGATSIGLVGASKGGTAVLTAAASIEVGAVIALSAPTIFENTNAIEGMPAVTAPTWIGVGEFDTDFILDCRNLYKASGAKIKHLEVVQSPDHGVALLPDLRAKILAFLIKYAPAQAG